MRILYNSFFEMDEFIHLAQYAFCIFINRNFVFSRHFYSFATYRGEAII